MTAYYVSSDVSMTSGGPVSSSTSPVTFYNLLDGDSLYVTARGSIAALGTHGSDILAVHGNGSITANIDGAIYDSTATAATFVETEFASTVRFSIGQAGSVEGFTGINFSTSYAYLSNAGMVSGQTDAILLGATAFNLVNSGLIEGNFGSGVKFASLASATATITNTGSIIGNNGFGVYLVTATGRNVINNSGIIAGSGDASTGMNRYGSIDLGTGNDSVVNTGQLFGDVSLQAGVDSFDGRNGTTNGVVFGGDGNDTLYGSKVGDDILDGGAGADYLNGSGGEDIASYQDATAGVRADLPSQSLNAGDAAGDRYFSIEDITGSSFDDTLLGDSNANVLDGGTGADTLYGRGGDDFLYGGADADTINAGLGTNYIDGGDGNDTLTYSDAAAGVTVDLSNSGAQATGGAGTDTITNIENLTGSAYADTLTGDANANTITGGAGADTMTGGLGDDVYVVDNAGDKVVELKNGGADTINAAVSYSLTGTYVETLVLTGTSGLTANGNSQANTLIGNGAANLLDGRGGADTLTGGAGADKFLFDTSLSTSAFATITDFSVGSDMIELDRTIFSAISANGSLAASAFGAGSTASTADQRILYDAGTGDIYYDSDGSGANAAIKFAHVTAGTALTASSFLAVT